MKLVPRSWFGSTVVFPALKLMLMCWVSGPPGAGKKTRVMALLRELYGAGVDRLRIEHQSFLSPSKKKIEIITLASNYHIEVNPSDVGIQDRVVIQELIKTVASAQQLNAEGQRSFKELIK